MADKDSTYLGYPVLKLTTGYQWTDESGFKNYAKTRDEMRADIKNHISICQNPKNEPIRVDQETRTLVMGGGKAVHGAIQESLKKEKLTVGFIDDSITVKAKTLPQELIDEANRLGLNLDEKGLPIPTPAVEVKPIKVLTREEKMEKAGIVFFRLHGWFACGRLNNKADFKDEKIPSLSVFVDIADHSPKWVGSTVTINREDILTEDQCSQMVIDAKNLRKIRKGHSLVRGPIRYDKKHHAAVIR